MKHLLFIVCLLITSFNSNSQTVDSPDFRNVKWGMTKEDVKRNESLKLAFDGGDYLRFSGNILNSTSSITYFFEKNKLVKAAVVFEQEHLTPNLYVDDFNSYKKSLTTKYGKPMKDVEKWHDDTFKEKPEDKGLAIAAEQLSCITMWITNSTRIGLFMSGEKYKINIAIFYDDKKYAENKENDDELRQTNEI